MRDLEATCEVIPLKFVLFFKKKIVNYFIGALNFSLWGVCVSVEAYVDFRIHQNIFDKPVSPAKKGWGDKL